MVLTDRKNTTIIGFVYNANQAPPPLPVIKGSSGLINGLENSVASEVAAWVVMLFMLFNIVYWTNAVRNSKLAERQKMLDAAQLNAPLMEATSSNGKTSSEIGK